MSLFDSGLTIHLSPDEFKDFSKVDPDRFRGTESYRSGPMQLYLTLVGRISHAGHLSIEDELAVKVHRYAYAYGDGTYQTAFRAVVKALWRAGWVQPDTEQHAERPEHKGRRWDGKQ